jgi:hypothetical protein
MRPGASPERNVLAWVISLIADIGLFVWTVDDIAHLEDREEHTNDDTADDHPKEYDQ